MDHAIRTRASHPSARWVLYLRKTGAQDAQRRGVKSRISLSPPLNDAESARYLAVGKFRLRRAWRTWAWLRRAVPSSRKVSALHSINSTGPTAD